MLQKIKKTIEDKDPKLTFTSTVFVIIIMTVTGFIFGTNFPAETNLSNYNSEIMKLYDSHPGYASFLLSCISLLLTIVSIFILIITAYYLWKSNENTNKQLEIQIQQKEIAKDTLSAEQSSRLIFENCNLKYTVKDDEIEFYEDNHSINMINIGSKYVHGIKIHILHLLNREILINKNQKETKYLEWKINTFHYNYLSPGNLNTNSFKYNFLPKSFLNIAKDITLDRNVNPYDQSIQKRTIFEYVEEYPYFVISEFHDSLNQSQNISAICKLSVYLPTKTITTQYENIDLKELREYLYKHHMDALSLLDKELNHLFDV